MMFEADPIHKKLGKNECIHGYVAPRLEPLQALKYCGPCSHVDSATVLKECAITLEVIGLDPKLIHAQRLLQKQAKMLTREFPVYNWSLAGKVPWREIVPGLSVQPRPCSVNDYTYWTKNVETRGRFFELVVKVISNQIIDSDAYYAALTEINVLHLTGSGYSDPYQSPNSGAYRAGGRTTEAIAGEESHSFARASPTARRYYLDRMFRKFQDLCVAASDAKEDFIAKVAAHHYHVMQYSLYKSGNHSMFMDIANGFLRMGNSLGTSHADWWMLARSATEDQFVKSFIGVVRRRNSAGMKQLASTHLS